MYSTFFTILGPDGMCLYKKVEIYFDHLHGATPTFSSSVGYLKVDHSYINTYCKVVVRILDVTYKTWVFGGIYINGTPKTLKLNGGYLTLE